jgi:membrane-bound serine protease (ClpP class)
VTVDIRRTILPLLALAVLLPGTLAQSSGETVFVADVDGTVTRGTAIHIEQAVDTAEANDAPLVIRLDTPGGLVSSTLEIDRVAARSDVPILTYVGPSGAWAQSAGTFIFLMGQPNGMAPNTQIGSAQPIQSSQGGGTQNASEKVENALVEKIRSIADRTGRNQTIAEQFITENRNLNATNATQLGMSDRVSPSLRAFLDDVDGEQARTASGTVTLDTEGATIERIDESLLVQTVDTIGNPQIAFVLFLIGLYGVIWGLAAPGTLVPETIGAVALVLGLIGLGLFDTSTSGLLLLMLAGLFFVAELLTPTHGVLTAAGAVALLVGVVFLLEEPLLGEDFLRQFQVVGLVSALVSGGVVFGAVTVALKSRTRPVANQAEGQRVQTATRLDPNGYVRYHGERWKAVTKDGPIEEGQTVLVVERDGLTLHVEPAGEPELAEPA